MSISISTCTFHLRPKDKYYGDKDPANTVRNLEMVATRTLPKIYFSYKILPFYGDEMYLSTVNETEK